MTSYSVKDRTRLAIIGPPVKTRNPITQGARNSQAQRVSWRLMPLARRPMRAATALPARGLVERGLGLALGPLQGRGRLHLAGQDPVDRVLPGLLELGPGRRRRGGEGHVLHAQHRLDGVVELGVAARLVDLAEDLLVGHLVAAVEAGEGQVLLGPGRRPGLAAATQMLASVM